MIKITYLYLVSKYKLIWWR